MGKKVELSIVTTLYKSQKFVYEFTSRMIAEAEKYTKSFELIFVDDGSPDSSGKVVKSLIAEDNRIILVELSRNFGHHYAVLAGLKQAQGELIFLLDSDLEEQPEWLGGFLHKITAKELDVVFGVQSQRQGNFFKKLSGKLFYKLFNLVSDTKIPENLCTARLMTKDYVLALGKLQDKNLFMAGNCAWTGFKQQPLSVEKRPNDRPSNYNIIKLFSLFLNAITSFTSYPLKIIFFIGVLLSTFSGCIGIMMIFEKLLHPTRTLLGYPSIMVSIWFLGGLIILFVGTIGLYLSKVFIEVKARPQFIIRKIYKGGV